MVGHLPFEGTNPAQVLRRVLDGQYAEAAGERATIGSRWSALIANALARVADDRFADASVMRDAIVAELARLKIVSPRRELESWLNDPAAYESSYPRRMIERLCALGSEERKGGDVLGAAADYNRALAFAPDDPQLCRIVLGMNRAEARMRFARRAVVALLLMLGLGAAAYGLGRLAQSKRGSEGATGLAPAGSLASSSSALVPVTASETATRSAPPASSD